MSHNNLKQVLIITYARACNYGSALQAYALNKYLRNNGFNVRTIDYTTEPQQKLYRLFEPMHSLMAVFRNIQSLFNYRQLKEHRRRFDRFIETKIPMTKPITDAEGFRTLSSEADYFICGSDQIWNTNCDDFDSNYMLSFVSEKQKCISYAPSLGGGESSPNTIEAIKKYVKGFKALSSREYAGAKAISSITECKVSTVLDPVFLLSAKEWKEIAGERLIGKDYILGYFIGDCPGMREFALKMSKSTHLPVIVIYKNLRDILYGFKNMYEAGPVDFVSLVLHSKGIVTNSFHAVAFSLIFSKDFWVFTGKSTFDSRISNILDIVGLSDRIIDSSADSITNYLAPVVYTAEKLEQLQMQILSSNNYLLSNLS